MSLNGPIDSDGPLENGSTLLRRSLSEPELGIVVRKCVHVSQPGMMSADTSETLSASYTAGDFRQRAATHGGSSTSMKKRIKLRKQRQSKSPDLTSNSNFDFNGLTKKHSQDLMKAQAFEKLQEQLDTAQAELKLKDEEVEKLSNLRNEVESELEELTASLFQEAHAMVLEANINQRNAEKKFEETNSKVEMLEAEVEALKTLVITSTPSKPGFRRRSTEQLNSCNSCGSIHCMTLEHSSENGGPNVNAKAVRQEKEVDSIVFKEFLAWMEDRVLDRTQPFLSRMYREDVLPCLDFNNKQLAHSLEEAISNNTLAMELMSTKGIRKKCSLTGAVRTCQYRAATSDLGEWHYICQSARHRIASVCDFFTYLRYIQHGLVKKDVADIFWEIMELRKHMACAKLGLVMV